MVGHARPSHPTTERRTIDDHDGPDRADLADQVDTPMTRMRDAAGGWLGALVAAVMVLPFGAWALDRVVFSREADEVAAAVPELADAVLLVSNLACDGRNSSGSGFAVELDGRPVVLTNRHVVEGAAQVGLRTLDGGGAPQVTGVLLADGADVAVLELAEAPASTLALGDAPAVADEVRLVGFPGGRPITTPGDVVDVAAGRLLLGMQVDGGASGAPVVDGDGTVVAQVFARTEEGTGVATPAPVVAAAALAARPAPGC